MSGSAEFHRQKQPFSVSSPAPDRPAAEPLARRRLAVTGVVQGVGFRPFVYALAHRLDLRGFVGNDSNGVFIEIEGPVARLDAFQRALVAEAPPLAHVEQVTAVEIAPRREEGFTIVHSQEDPSSRTLVSPDVATCEDCLRELFDPTDRRYLYPFINCTNCGPRFTIVRDLPYDRPLTTMATFPLCADCRSEYEDPGDRRFHAQPVACPACGPRIWLEERRASGGWRVADGVDVARSPATNVQTLQRVRSLLDTGQVVAIKGLGGFHLACDATSDAALQTLRQRKGRVDKPFALMVGDVAAARRLAHVSAREERLLTSPARPIVLLRKRAGAPLSELVAPGNDHVGVMLPYTPLHHLLFGQRERDRRERTSGNESLPHPPVPFLVMTSANRSDEPIVKENEEARQRLSALADALLLHDRSIHVRCDDSVMRMVDGVELPIRRSRGYAPFPVRLPIPVPPLLAVGGELKSTFCLAAEQHAFLSQHIGDMEHWETLTAFSQAVEHFQHIFRIEPAVIACDRHPDYLSTRWAQDHAADRTLVAVQHHHAHVAACMAEHGLDGSEPVIGVCFDGTGYGDDGAVWGGEIFLADYRGYERLAHLRYVPLAGGDAAVERPYRMALAHLWAAGEAWTEDLPCVAACPDAERRVLRHQLQSGLNAVPTSSVGRLFDAVAALIGVRSVVTYEAQAAIELEALATGGEGGAYPFGWHADTFDAVPLIEAIVADLRTGLPRSVIAHRFHAGVADLIHQAVLRARRQHGARAVVLSGGVFQNVILLRMAQDRLRADGFQVFTHRLVPPNDGGLALGQVMVAAATL